MIKTNSTLSGAMRLYALVLSGFLIQLMLMSCGSAEISFDATGYSEDAAYAKEAGGYDDPSADYYAPETPAEAVASSRAMASPPLGTEGQFNPADSGSAAQGTQVQERKQIFSGYVQLEVSDVEEIKSRIRELALSLEGYVEQSYQNRISIRVPRDDFLSVFNQLLAMGLVLDQSISSYDVTDSYQDLETRLKLARDTRERLYTLLEQTTDVEERVAILREIRRLSEEIESINATLTRLQESLNFSRIDIILKAALSTASGVADIIPFPWIALLQPGVKTSGRLPASAMPDPGDNFAVFSDSAARGFYAESARGVRIFAGTVKNQPKGDLDFWDRALMYHLGKRYADSQEISLSADCRGGSFTSYDYEPYVYEVFIQMRGTRIAVYEAFYPTRELYEESRDSVHDAIAKAVSR